MLDPTYGYILLAKNLYFGKRSYTGAWNLGPDKSNINVISLVNKFKKYINIKTKIKKIKNNYIETNRLRLNTNKAKKYLSWKPLLTLSESIKLTSEWYLNSKDFNKIRKLIDQQIDFYSKKIK